MSREHPASDPVLPADAPADDQADGVDYGFEEESEKAEPACEDIAFNPERRVSPRGHCYSGESDFLNLLMDKIATEAMHPQRDAKYSPNKPPAMNLGIAICLLNSHRVG